MPFHNFKWWLCWFSCLLLYTTWLERRGGAAGWD